VTQDLASVQRHPVESSVGEVVDVVPAELLSKESAHACKSTKLRKLSRVAKGVRKPEGCASLTEATLVVSLTVQELSDQRLSAWHVGVMFNPAATDGHKIALLDLALDTIESRWVKSFQPFVLLCLRGHETVLRVSFQKVALVEP